MLIETIRFKGCLPPVDPPFSAAVAHRLAQMRCAPGLLGQAFGHDAAADEFLVVSIWKTTDEADAAAASNDPALLASLAEQAGTMPTVERLPLISWVSPPLEALVREMLQNCPDVPGTE